jgi:hypothetical protein
MRRTLALTLFIATLAGLSSVLAAGGGSANLEETKEALQELNDYIGQWKGSGGIESNKLTTWRETAEWSWKFKKDDVYLTLTIPDGKFVKKGELRYIPKGEKFQLTILEDGDNRVFVGKASGTRLMVERVDPKTQEAQQIKMLIAGGGIRFIYTYLTKPANRTLFDKQFEVAFTKEGESFGASAKKPECVVTGGLGTSTVSYNGQTYYVCCSGCRDAFNENPAKIVAEYKKKKRK